MTGAEASPRLVPAPHDPRLPVAPRHVLTRHILTRHVLTRHVLTRHVLTRHVLTRHVLTANTPTVLFQPAILDSLNFYRFISVI